MKRLVAAVIFIAFSLTLSFSTYYILKSKVTDLTILLEEAMELSAAESPNISEKNEEIIFAWKKTSKIMHMMIIHAQMDDLEVNILCLSDYLSNSDFENYNESCIRSIHQLEHIRESLIPNWGNVF